MTPPTTLRRVTLEDAAAILRIYAPNVEKSAISFEYEVPSLEEMRSRIRTITEHYPWIVAERGGEVLAYAYASRFRTRTAYDWCCESTVYVAENHHREGLGRKLYTLLFDLLQRQGFVTIMAGITLPNVASVRLHESLGFVPNGICPAVGYKFGAWHDLGLWSLALGPLPSAPLPPCHPSDIVLVPR